MYESPINIIYRDIKTKFENEVLQAVQAVDINVNKSELIKALQYDRNQYEKGYADAQAERKKGEWEEKKVFNESFIEQWQSARCSVCGLYHTTPYGYYFYHFNFCPHCGADMRGDETDDMQGLPNSQYLF